MVKQKRNPITFLLKLEFLKEQGFQGAKQESLPLATAGARAGGSTPQQNIGALAMVGGRELEELKFLVAEQRASGRVSRATCVGVTV